MRLEVEHLFRRETLQLTGRVLYLTKDPELIRQQIDQERDFSGIGLEDLLDGVSTDAIIPNHACYSSRTASELGDYALTGLPGGVIRKGDLSKGKFEAIVGGKSFGRGSSREHAQLALGACGIRVLCAEDFERIFASNCVNYGLLMIDGKRRALIKRFLDKDQISLEEFLEDLSPLNQLILNNEGLIKLTRLRTEGKITFPMESSSRRPMTIAEKIIAAHAVTSNTEEDNNQGVEFTEPGRSGFVRTDLCFGYELQSPVTIAAIRNEFGNSFKIKDPSKVIFFEDHLALLGTDDATVLRDLQSEFATERGIRVFRFNPRRGVEGICHTVMLERYALPNQLILGNDSHTCTLGAVGALAIGKGASELAAALISGDTPITVPDTIRFNLNGQLPFGSTSKDLMLYILSLPQIRQLGSGKVFEYGGPGLRTMPFDEQVVLANMAIEGNAFTGIIEPNDQTYQYLESMRGIRIGEIAEKAAKSDLNANFFRVFDIDLPIVEPMISLPGDPQNSIPLSRLQDKPNIDIAYIGSCTGGKLEDLSRAAKILRGRKINPHVRLYAQASSLNILRQAQNLGITKILEDAGAIMLLPGCGACMNAGPGSSTSEDQITISDTNRNFYGRMGRGQTYLSNVEVVAASAITGRINSPLYL